MAGFVAASVACAVAGSAGELIAARAAQGLMGAIMLPQVFGLIRDLFAAHEMGKAAPAVNWPTTAGWGGNPNGGSATAAARG
jgi:MFS family permease